MYAVGRLGSYITRGVYTVSGPFHPFGGAVDIIVVEQQDGSFKSSPWYVRFGKFQGVLKAKEKVVTINVNGIQADFHMYLDHKGEAYFLREVDGEEADSVFYPSSSGEDTDGQSSDRATMKSKSCNFDAGRSNLVTQLDVGNGKILTRTNSRRSRILGFVFGKKSMKSNTTGEEDDGTGVVRADSLERAQIAADLLEVKWSTNLEWKKHQKDNVFQSSPTNTSGGEADKALPIDDPWSERDFPLHSESGLHFNSETVSETDGLGLANANYDENDTVSISEITGPDSVELNPGLSKKPDEEQDFKDKSTILPESCVSVDESGEDGVIAFVRNETLESSGAQLDDSAGKADETLYVSYEGVAEVCVHSETAQEAAEQIYKVNSVQETSLLVAKEHLDFPDHLADNNSDSFFTEAHILGGEESSSKPYPNGIVTETYAEMVTFDSRNGSIKEVESCSIRTISGLNNSINEVEDGENTKDIYLMNKHELSSEPVYHSLEFEGNIVPRETVTVSPSEGPDEEQLLFGDLDDLEHGGVKLTESVSLIHTEKENHPCITPESSEALLKSVDPSDESYSSPYKFVQENVPSDVEFSGQGSKMVSSCIDVPKRNKEDRGRMAESLPIIQSDINHLVVDDHSLGLSLDSNPKSPNWFPLDEDISSCVDSEADKKEHAFLAQSTVEDPQNLEELKNASANLAVGDPSKAIDATNGSWRHWPFSFKRSRSMKTTQLARNSSRSSDPEDKLENSTRMDGEKDVLTSTVKKKKKLREITPTPEQLASLNLKEGMNTVTFTFSTSMLGEQQVDARIFLWRWDTRVVISDVDGTITKSDVLGQFMPLVGMDWSQTGVAHLFSAIKENGYQLLFLSARSISQSYHTRQFLFNLKQDGKALPEGPVLISPDGLFPSLFREVIRRAPHEFKIACLEDIRALFPPDHNPFYAGFGNRDTDEISYLKVGIPKGKIFIINPKGQVAVHRQLDTKSYTSLHTLVHDMFPPMPSSEQEDFNSWNYWKLPLPAI
ncbi:phosphatidate phosphatase PAH2-like isoform X2 [Diospyros lotus]|uniref:phosphatidate phosphatase PAH2-like isoform X2 n=1 Tax=Diospyros lotus TaxID=55363 RepID=UPI00225AB69F|nr:phosphatidate phosphatase PAH2-like isoform X2 [Diospyros lotus]